MIKGLIIDDEVVAVNLLDLMIKRHIPEITELKCETDPQKAVQLIPEFKPDIIFLDIEMPYLNGFELLKALPEIPFSIVFTTAYDKYAVQAIKFSALDYLLKPIDATDLRETFDRFLEKTMATEIKDAAVKNLLSNLEQQNKMYHKLALPTSNGIEFFPPHDIIRCEGMSNYTKFYISNHSPIITSKTIKEYEEILLSHQFVRIHKSHLINAKYVKGYHAQNSNIIMNDGTQVEVSRRRKREALEGLGIKN
jgi:two-component system LytT family response regulator